MPDTSSRAGDAARKPRRGLRMGGATDSRGAAAPDSRIAAWMTGSILPAPPWVALSPPTHETGRPPNDGRPGASNQPGRRSTPFSGTLRTRLPVAAKMAFSTAGAATAMVGSPMPPQKPPEGMMMTSTAGMSFISMDG